MTEAEATSVPSVLGDLRSRRRQVVQTLHLDLKVPHWDDPDPAHPDAPHPPIFVRYRAVGHDHIAKARRKMEEAKKAMQGQVELQENIDLLVKSVECVYSLVDDQEVSLRVGDPFGEKTMFDGDLAHALGMGDDGTNVNIFKPPAIVRQLFLMEGDIISHAAKILEWNGYREAEADEELRGESESAGATS